MSPMRQQTALLVPPRPTGPEVRPARASTAGRREDTRTVPDRYGRFSPWPISPS